MLGILALAAALSVGCDTSVDANEAMQRGDYPKALRLWRDKAEAGDAQAQNTLGVMYYMGLGVPRDLPRSAQWFLKAAKNGDPKAQFNLGMMYYNAYGVPNDLLQSYMWLYAADQANHPHAHIYMVGMGSMLTSNMKQKAHSMVAPYLQKPAN